MKPLRLDRLTREIGLVLISSSLVLGGCSHPCDDRPPGDQAVPDQPRADCRGGRAGGGHGGHVPVGGRPIIVTPGAGGGTRTPAAGSARGGFGATGHATAGGS